MKYALYIDYKESYKYEYRTLMVNSLEGAISEADKLYDADEHFLLRIMKKDSAVERDGYLRKAVYKAILCKRSHGWHLNNTENCESEHLAVRWYAKDYECYEAI